eukprot:1248160-Prymnesium_polylepis.1
MPDACTVRRVSPCVGPLVGERPSTTSCSAVNSKIRASDVYCCPLSVTSSAALSGHGRRGETQSIAELLSGNAGTVAGTPVLPQSPQ